MPAIPSANRPIDATPVIVFPFIVRFNQYAACLASRLITHVGLGRRVRLELELSDIPAGSKYVIAANHQSVVDPFVICSDLPFRMWSRLNGFGFVARPGLFVSPMLRAASLSLGCFPAKPVGQLPSGTAAAQAYLANGQSVVIFPEGHRTLPSESSARAGIAVLAEDPSVRVIPVHLQWTRGWRRSYQMTIGKPLPTGLTAQQMMDAIYALELP